jgi:BASS family bile acid:Na+ symporter
VSRFDRAATILEDYLVLWIVVAVGIGLAFPSFGRLSPLTTPILAVMVGSVSLTLSPTAFRRVRPRAVGLLLLGQIGMPVAAFAVARALSLPPAVTVGFVVLGAVTPELVSPVMTELAGGNTALSTVVLVLVGLGSISLVPLAVTVLLGATVPFDPVGVVRTLLLAVVLPMAVAVGLRARFPDRVGRYDRYYPSVSALMVVLVIGIVTAANAGLVRGGSRGTLLVVLVGAAVLNGVGYALGWLLGRPLTPDERVTALFSVGMRDFAVAAGVVVAAGFPPAAALPAVAFGLVEMVSSAALARHLSRHRRA